MVVLWITAFVVLLDQASKLMVKGSPWHWLPLEGIPYGHSIPFIDDVVRITYIENPGIAFGINIPGFKVFFAVFSIVASVAILIYLKRNLHRLRIGERIALALILGGAIGNLIDRVFYGVFFHEQPLFYGRVVDFIDFGVHRNMFPVFNVADSSVTIGVSVLVILMMRHKQPAVAPIPEAPANEHSDDTSTVQTSSEATETSPI
ncbi:MAG: signal peptidase II [Candidatus Kapaibacterium sp.]